MLGCTRLGMTYDFGNDTDYNKATNLYEKACDGGDMWGCNNLATEYLFGHGERRIAPVPWTSIRKHVGEDLIGRAIT